MKSNKFIFYLLLCLVILTFLNFLNHLPIYGSSAENRNTTNTNEKPRYYYNNQRREPKKVVTSGAVRGHCPGETSKIFLQILAPNDHLGLTTQNHPTFFWYLNLAENQPRIIKFTLIEVGQVEPIFEEKLRVSPSYSPNLMSLTLPQSTKPLTINQTYRWTVTIICNPQRPSSNYFSSTTFQVIFLESTPKNYSAEEQAILLAGKGVWYDSLYYAYLSNNTELFTKLLNEINIFLPTE